MIDIHYMPSTMKPLILVDGSSYLYRAYHALPALTNSRGFQTGAVYGFVNMLKRLMSDYQPSYMAVVFDTPGKTFRDEIYAEYKATRTPMPDELVSQIEPIHKIIQALGIPLLAIPGVEADDVIGTLVEHAKRAGVKTIVSTGDKDLAQLVNGEVTLINTMTNVRLDPDGVMTKFGVTPERMIDYLTLVGDTSDNIPGVPQVGPKTAAKWLQIYGSLDNIIANASQITGKVGENLRASLAHLPLTKTLVTIKRDVDLPIDFVDLDLKSNNVPNLIQLYKELEFKTWLAELLADASQPSAVNHQNYHLITTESELNHLIKLINQSPLLVIDAETTSVDCINCDLVGIALAINLEKPIAAYIPFGHDYQEAPEQLTKSIVLSKLKPILENKSIKKIGHNIKFDIQVFAKYDLHLHGNLCDTMLESYLLDSASHNHDMDSLALKYLGRRTIPYEEIAGKGSQQLTFNQIDLNKAFTYAAEDAEITLRLHANLWPRVEQNEKLNHVFETIEMPLVSVLARMETTGVLIAPNLLIAQEEHLKTRLATLEQEAFILANQPFNINSPKQLQEILFDKLKLPVLQKTPKGQASTADSVLQELALEFMLPRIIIEFRSISKLISTYTTSLVQQINPKTKRIHTSYNQTGTSTGRLSSREPNLQNIPIRTEEGRRIRQAFIAKPGYKLISADYSQIELRLMAHISQDPTLIKAFQENLDIHKSTASEVWEIPLDEVTPEMRRNAKAINFGLIYGMSAFGLTRQLGIERKAAEEYINRYFTRYPEVKLYMEKTRAIARKNGFVETLWGRKLVIPDINSSQIMRQKAAERAAINAPLQGSAADIIKLAMIQIDEWLILNKIPAQMIMQVHDELVFEVSENIVGEFIEQIRHHMTSIIQLDIPLIVEVGVGDNWDAASAH